jgi:AcrR family transcriptional regulator
MSRSKGLARPKAYQRASVLMAARDLFWECGYEATSISALEARTGLNRSSLYQDFGSKHELLEEVIGCYVEEVVGSMLADLH